jgi:ribosome-binding ATPase
MGLFAGSVAPGGWQLEIGLIGLPRAGKTALFDALTGLRSEAGSAARATHTAVVKVPDARVDRLSGIFTPRKTTYAEVTFVDPAAERADAAPKGPFPETTANALRDVDALVHVVRVFTDPSVPASPGSTSPAADLRAMEEELILRDLALVERRLERLRKERGKPDSAAEAALLEPALAHLEQGKPLRELAWTEEHHSRLRGFQFLSLKPALVVLNIGEEALGTTQAEIAALEGFRVLPLCVKVEREIAELPAAEQQDFLEQMGLERPARDVFLRAAYELLELLSFFTVGEDEVRAWSVRAGSTAWIAAGKIHTDIQRGFIRAESIHYEEFLRVGSLGAAKTQGVLRLEGKEYRVRDGDILHFRFSV